MDNLPILPFYVNNFWHILLSGKDLSMVQCWRKVAFPLDTPYRGAFDLWNTVHYHIPSTKEIGEIVIIGHNNPKLGYGN